MRSLMAPIEFSSPSGKRRSNSSVADQEVWRHTSRDHAGLSVGSVPSISSVRSDPTIRKSDGRISPGSKVIPSAEGNSEIGQPIAADEILRLDRASTNGGGNSAILIRKEVLDHHVPVVRK